MKHPILRRIPGARQWIEKIERLEAERDRLARRLRKVGARSESALEIPPQRRRADYKAVWTQLSETKSSAKLHVGGVEDESWFELTGFDLHPFVDGSVDVVCSTVVFMHLEEWDRFNYVLEAYRVLRPGGRIFVDNVNLCSDEGWRVFEIHRQIPPNLRPAHITKHSTVGELKTYLRRARFTEIRSREVGEWIQVWATK
jgi:SAM-dependent methyltransferase